MGLSVIVKTTTIVDFHSVEWKQQSVVFTGVQLHCPKDPGISCGYIVSLIDVGIYENSALVFQVTIKCCAVVYTKIF